MCFFWPLLKGFEFCFFSGFLALFNEGALFSDSALRRHGGCFAPSNPPLRVDFPTQIILCGAWRRRAESEQRAKVNHRAKKAFETAKPKTGKQNINKT